MIAEMITEVKQFLPMDHSEDLYKRVFKIMKDKLKIRLCSDLDYEEMVADICYEEYTVATVTQEKGENNM